MAGNRRIAGQSVHEMRLILANRHPEAQAAKCQEMRSQGIGRLIRTKTDTKIVVILYNRILTKAYGRVCLASLPQCPVEVV